MGGVAFAGFLLAVVAYRVTFCFTKAIWKLPVALNAVGAIFMSAGAFMFWQFLTNNIGRAHSFSMPEVPITVPATYIMLSVSWYIATIKLSSAFADAIKSKKQDQY